MATPFSFDKDVIVVGIGDYHVGGTPMASIGLGSCVGLILHHEARHTGGLAHVMLPASQGRADRPGKYADTAVDILLRDLKLGHGEKNGITAKLTGGATMFKDFSGSLNIGQRNIETLRAALQERHITVVSEDVGGDFGRSILYYPADRGRVVVRKAEGSCKEL